MFNLTPDRQKLLITDGHILVLGGPGSGKTTVALLKAEKLIHDRNLKASQRILFLSFARATVARIAQEAGKLISDIERKSLEINTYHGFSWKILQSHGYLLSNQRIRLFPPPEASARLAEIETDARPAEINRLFELEGLLHFDLFAKVTTELLSRSLSLAKIICDAYPIIILDEFQDTNENEWQMIKAMGKYSCLIALADADQRIYGFRGADPKRISEFIATYTPTPFDFGTENNRSNGTDINIFGNDLLIGTNKAKTYNDVTLIKYPFRGAGHLDIKLEVLKGCQRLNRSGPTGWSIAVLVPSKKLMMEVSEYFMSEQRFSNGKRLPVLSHDVAMDTEGPALAAVLIATLLEGSISKEQTMHQVIQHLCAHIRGRKGNKRISQSEITLVTAIQRYIDTGIIRGTKRKLLLDECGQIADKRRELKLSGDPWEDWLIIRRLFADSRSKELFQVAEDAKYLRLLHKGAVLRSRLSELWKLQKSYAGAVTAVQEALLQEHFAASTKVWQGIHVMTIHKSKGKEFDEVLIYEGSFHGRIVHTHATESEIAQARLALRVAVTRAKKHATILTPKKESCRFL